MQNQATLWAIIAILIVLVFTFFFVTYHIKKAKERQANGPRSCPHCGWTVPPWFTGPWWLSYCPDCDRDLMKQTPRHDM